MNHVGLKMTRTELKVKVDAKKATDIIFDLTKRHEFDENFLEVISPNEFRAKYLKKLMITIFYIMEQENPQYF